MNDSYCKAKNRKSLKKLVEAAVFLLLGLAVGVYGISLISGDRSRWSSEEYGKAVVACLLTAGFLAGGVYCAYIALRNTLCPEKSELARSIRSHLPNTTAASGVKELYAVVDRDIHDNGQWFDGVAVGKEWVLGDVASYIPRIRLIFGRDEVVRHGSGQYDRVVELIIMDDRRQVQKSGMHDPRELLQVIECIKLRAPDAEVRPYSEYYDWRRKSEEDWQRFLIDYRRRQGEREWGFGISGSGPKQNMVLTLSDGSVTSRVTKELVEHTLMECFRNGEDYFVLTPGCPVETADGLKLTELECCTVYDGDPENVTSPEAERTGETNFILKVQPSEPNAVFQEGFTISTDGKQAREILGLWLDGSVAELKKWVKIRLSAGQTKVEEKKKTSRYAYLGLLTMEGVFQSHEYFTTEDVEIAADGIVNDIYQEIELVMPGGYLWMKIHIGDSMDGRCHVYASKVDYEKGKVHLLRTRATHRQAAKWFVDYAAGRFIPEGREWKDYTRKVRKKKA